MSIIALLTITVAAVTIAARVCLLPSLDRSLAELETLAS